MKLALRVSWWLNGLKIQCCHCGGSGLIPGPGTADMVKKKKKPSNYIVMNSCWYFICFPELTIMDQKQLLNMKQKYKENSEMIQKAKVNAKELNAYKTTLVTSRLFEGI